MARSAFFMRGPDFFLYGARRGGQPAVQLGLGGERRAADGDREAGDGEGAVGREPVGRVDSGGAGTGRERRGPGQALPG